MNQFSIENQLKESFQKQSKDFYVSAIKFFNLHQFVLEHGTDALKSIPNDFDFYDERGFEECCQFAWDQLFDYYSNENDMYRQRIIEYKEGKITLAALWLRIYMPDEQHLTLECTACPGPEHRVSLNKDEYGFGRVSILYMIISLIYESFFEVIEDPCAKQLFPENEPINFFYGLSGKVYMVKAEEMRMLCYWFPIDGAPKAFTLIGQHKGGVAMQSKKAARIEKVCEGISREYIRKDNPYVVTMTRSQWKSINPVVSDRQRDIDKPTIEKKLGVKIEIVSK